MSNYRDTVREMMRDLKKGPSIPAAAPEAPNVQDVPDEEELLDDILDLEEGAPPPMDEAEAEQLLSSSPVVPLEAEPGEKFEI